MHLNLKWFKSHRDLKIRLKSQFVTMFLQPKSLLYRCLGIQWQSNFSASESINVNIHKARRSFFDLGSTGAFHGKLNPLSGSSIFETCILGQCILPVLLYGCETWFLDSTCLQALEKFQCEIGRHILKLSNTMQVMLVELVSTGLL